MTELVLTPWKSAFLNHVRDARRSVTLVCPYIKFNVVSEIRRQLQPGVQVQTVTRCKISDFAAGASDIDAVYALSGLSEPESGMRLRIDNRLHAKIFIFDCTLAFVGSSNITFSGLQRNFEAVVRTDNPAFVRSLVTEVESYWETSTAVSEQMLLKALDDLKDLVRSTPVPRERNEHFYQPPENTDEIGTPSGQQDNVIEAAIERTPVVNQEPAFESTPRLTSTIDRTTVPIKEAIAEFIDTVKQRFGVFFNVDDLPITVAGIASDYGSYTNLFNPEFEDPLDGKPVTNNQFTAINGLGREIWRLAMAFMCIRGGIMQRFGTPGSSALTNGMGGQKTLALLWDQNLLSAPLCLAATTPKSVKAQTCSRLFCLMALQIGIAGTIDIIEEFFNPLDVIGDDFVALTEIKDSKTLLQEAAQSLQRRVSYDDYTSEGTSHDPKWSCAVRVGALKPIRAEGETKGKAEQVAAKAMLDWMQSDPAWRAVLADQRGQSMDRIRRNGPWTLSPRFPDIQIVSDVTSTFEAQNRLGLPDSIVFPAFIDRAARSRLGLTFDNEALGFLGAAVINAVNALHTYRKGDFDLSARQREMWAKLHEVVLVDEAWKQISVEKTISDPLRQTVIQALVGGMVVRLGRAEAFRLTGALLARLQLVDVQAMASGKPTGLAVLSELPASHAAGRNFTEILQRVVQAYGDDLPQYSASQSGPDHDPTFRCIVRWRSWQNAAEGRAKRTARDHAAYLLLVELNRQHNRGLISAETLNRKPPKLK